ncbi:MAG: tetratricopeptide repeat protein [Planctomycetes bacterium]|nr:tetratricopeptide repeat protein [Planctomycetota bacterium]
MNQTLEVFGRGVTVDTASLIVGWLCEYRAFKDKEGGLESGLDEIVSLLAERKPDALESALRCYLFSHPHCIPAHLANAASALQNRDLALAVEELLWVYAKQPSNTVCLYALGFCHELRGQAPKAIEYYQDCLKFKMNLELPLQRLAAIYVKNRQFDHAIEHYQCLTNISPDDISLQVTLGYLQAASGDPADAINTFNAAILLHPDSLLFQDSELERLVDENELPDALDYIDVQLAIYPGRADLLAKRGDILVMLGETSEAISAYSESMNLCPGFLDVAVKLGTLHMKNENFLPAASLFVQAMEINDQITDAYLGLALAHRRSQDTNGALAAMYSASMILPNSILLFCETAKLLVTTLYGRSSGSAAHGGLMEEELPDSVGQATAIDAHKAQIAMQPSNPAPYYRLGMMQLKTEGPHVAKEAFRHAVTICPTYCRANAKLSLCLLGEGDNEGALQRLEHNDTVTAESFELHYQTALLYSDRLKFASSLLNLSRNLTRNLTDIDFASQIAVVLEGMGAIDKAEALWDGLHETLVGAQGLIDT